ncbi:MAG: HisA/HisF-related TIM barrel protein [Bdellovibrionales bacterium]
MFRVIPVLTMTSEGLFRTRRFRTPVYVGDPINALRIFNAKEVDEMVIADIGPKAAWTEEHFGYLAKLSSQAFMPLAYAGRLFDVEPARRILRSGFEKVVFNSALTTNARAISQIATEFGSQATVVSLDVRSEMGLKRVYIQNGQQSVKEDWISLVRRAQDLGAGELYLRNIDHDGEMNGFDLEIVQEAAAQVSIPIVAVGGAGRIDDLVAARRAGASAAAVGSWFVFYGRYRAVLINHPAKDELEAAFATN